jgi:hypothetical protein
MKLQLAVVCLVLVLVVLTVIGYQQNQENFDGEPQEDNISIHPDLNLRNMLLNIRGEKPKQKTSAELAAKAIAQEYCPVTPDFDPSQYIKKTEIKEAVCPKVPDLKDFVLKSSIPPIQNCPSCVCPKVKVAGGLCKKCPDPKMVCPPPQPCGYEECKSIIKCGPNDQIIPPCPKCPEVKACPKEPVKICPAIKLPSPEDLKCPPPQPCPVSANGKQCPKCTYKGIKNVEHGQTIDEMMAALIKSNDSESRNKLKALKKKLDGLNLNKAKDLQDKLNNQNKTIAELEQQLLDKELNAQITPNIDPRLDDINAKLASLMDQQNSGNNSEKNIRRNNGEDTDIEEDIEPVETTVKPHDSYANKCASKPSKYNTYNVVGAALM